MPNYDDLPSAEGYPHLKPIQPGERRNPEGHNQYTHPKIKFKNGGNLPPIVIEGDKIPFKVSRATQKDTSMSLWQRQGKHVLEWASKRIWQYIIYQEKGVHDPLGEFMFQTYFKQLVKSAGSEPLFPAQQPESSAPVSLDNKEGRIKEYRKQLIGQLKDLDNKAASIETPEVYDDIDPDELAIPGVSSLPDDFKI